MDSPQPSKNNNGTSCASKNTNTNTNDVPSSDSPYVRYVSTLSPLPSKPSHAAQSFVGPTSPLPVFKSPRISHRETQFIERPRGIRSLGGVKSQSDNGSNSLGEDPESFTKSISQQPLPERIITETQNVFDSENDANAQHCSSTPSIDDFLADPGDNVQMYLADQDGEQSTDTAETTLSDPIQSKKNILNFDRKDGPGDSAEESMSLSEESNKVHQQKPAYGEEPENIDEDKNEVEWASEVPVMSESILVADTSDIQYSYDPLPQDVKECEDYNGNILQDGSEATLNYHGISRRCLQFGEAASNALGSNISHAKLNAASIKMIKVKEVDATVDTDVGNSEELNEPPSPCKKKKKTAATADNNGRKHCNCKKSKCLKLYCECFNAGNYCIDPCGCQDCTNRPEYAETVMESKQQIEIRNPDAFTSKIIQHTTDISSNNMEDSNLTTPSSARHKRGCNCRKSKCQKKYCECFQANVGCSSACRCEGCTNAYGKREERMNTSTEKGSDCTSHDELDMVAGHHAYDQGHLSPITPSFQHADQGKEAAKSRVISGNYLLCSEYDVNMFASRSNDTKSSENLHSTHALLETNEMLGTAPYDPQIESTGVLVHPTAPFHPKNSRASFSSVMNEWKNNSQSQLSDGHIHQLPGNGSSLHWHSSPSSHTPSTTVGEAQYLHCPEETSTHMTSVKVNSPSQKRISPSRGRHYGIGSSSSGGFRSGRKFTLDRVPCFPSLSPCVDSKGNGNEDLGNSQSK